MSTITFETTDAEDAAILALGLDATVQAFGDRHLRHQINFALSQLPTIADKFNAASPALQAQITDLLKDVKPPKGKP